MSAIISRRDSLKAAAGLAMAHLLVGAPQDAAASDAVWRTILSMDTADGGYYVVSVWPNGGDLDVTRSLPGGDVFDGIIARPTSADLAHEAVARFTADLDAVILARKTRNTRQRGPS